MTRSSQKSEEVELVKIFLSAYYPVIDNFIIEPYDDNKPEKLDVVAHLPDIPNEIFNFQVKEIEYHPNDKTQKDFSNEMGATKDIRKGKQPKMKAYDYGSQSSWQTAMDIFIKEHSKQYNMSVKNNMDLLYLINDSSLTDDKSSFTLDRLASFGFRSISCIIYGKGKSLVLYASSSAPTILKINRGKMLDFDQNLKSN